MKGSHVRVLRGYIQDDLNAASIQFTWGWDDWEPHQDSEIPVKAIYFTKMRDAIQALWHSKGRGPLPNWTQEPPQGPSSGSQTSSLIRATHVTDLRAWLNQYEGNHPPVTQGIDSRSYDPLEVAGQIIYNVNPNDWTGDVQQLASARPFCSIEDQWPQEWGAWEALDRGL